MDQIGGKIGYHRTVRSIREYVLSRVRSKRVPVYIFTCMLRVVRSNWTVAKCDFWHIGVTFGTRQQVEVSTQNFSQLDKL